MAHGMKGEREYYLKRPGKGGLEPASSAKFNEKDGLFFSELLPPMECSDRREYKSISHPRAGKSLMLVVRDQDGTVVGYKLRKASSWDDWRAGEAVPNAIELRTLRFLRDQLKPNVDSALFAPQDSMLVEELYRTGDLRDEWKGMMWRSLKADAWPGIDEGLARLDVDSLRAMHRLVEYCMLPLPRFDEELKEKLGGLDRKSLDRVASSSRKIINYLVVNDFEVLSQDERLLDNDGLNEALKSLSHYNKSNSTEDRRRAASMLERHYALWTINIGLEQRQKGVRNMVAALSDPDYLVRKKMAAAVGYLKSPQAVDALNNLLDDPSAAVRKNAALALENIGESRSIDTLRQRLEHEEDREVVDYLRVAIESLKKKSN